MSSELRCHWHCLGPTSELICFVFLSFHVCRLKTTEYNYADDILRLNKTSTSFDFSPMQSKLIKPAPLEWHFFFRNQTTSRAALVTHTVGALCGPHVYRPSVGGQFANNFGQFFNLKP